MTTPRDNLAGEIAKVLGEHWAAGMSPSGAAREWECECGEPLEMSDEAHRAHLADALADLLADREQRAAATAWFEGWESRDENPEHRIIHGDAEDRP